MCVVLPKEEKIKAEAGRSFVAKMRKPAFVVKFLVGAGVVQSPCFCCLHQKQGTCPHPVHKLDDCKDYIIFSVSPDEVEKGILLYVSAVNLQRRKQLAA